MATPRTAYKLTPEVRGQLLAALRAGAGIEHAARAVGVTGRAVYKAMDRDDGFKRDVRESRDFADEIVEKRLFDCARGGNVPAIKFWLVNRKAERWKERVEQRTEVVGFPSEIHIRIRGAGEDLPATNAALPGARTPERIEG